MLFSIVIPTYNRSDLIKSAMESVLAQTFQDWELIVIDDASTDDTPAVLSSYHDPRIRVYRNEQNRERSASRNRGIEAAQGDYLCFLDSDDIYLPHHLETLARAICEAPIKEAMFFTQFVRKHPDREEQVVYPPVGPNPVEYIIRNQIATPTTCFHRSLLAKNRFDLSLKINEDVELFARIVAAFPLNRIETATVQTLMHETNTAKLVTDYVTPQIVAMRKIFGQREVRGKISKAFKREILINLHHQLIPIAWRGPSKLHAFWILLTFLIKYPGEPLNSAKFILLLGTTPLSFLIPSIGRASKVIGDSYY